MRIKTMDFGEIEVAAENVIHFAEGIFAFETLQDYVLLNYDVDHEDGPIMSLQSTDGSVGFTVVDPVYFLPTYAPRVSRADQEKLGCTDSDQLRFWAIAIIGQALADTVINLKSPLVLNSANGQGIQVVLENGDYPLRYHLFADDGDVK